LAGLKATGNEKPLKRPDRPASFPNHRAEATVPMKGRRSSVGIEPAPAPESPVDFPAPTPKTGQRLCKGIAEMSAGIKRLLVPGIKLITALRIKNLIVRGSNTRQFDGVRLGMQGSRRFDRVFHKQIRF
jgi:hypothetical protein